MSKNFLYEGKLELSKKFPPGTETCDFGKYRRIPVPNPTANQGEAILAFRDTFGDSEGGGSHPEEEARMITGFLSLILNTRVKPNGFRYNHIDIPERDTQVQLYPEIFGQFDANDLESLLDILLSQDEALVKQFIRACRAYSTALDFVPSDPTFAFFLLVVAGECLSSQDAVIPFSELQPDKKSCERFCRFVKENFPESAKSDDEKNEQLLIELLKTIYYTHRSGFAHAGREVSNATLMADKAKSSYFKHRVDGHDVKTPGLAWFAKMIRGSLMGFLIKKKSTTEKDEEIISRLAFEKAGFEVKFKRGKQKGEVVTFGDIEYR